MSGTVRFGVDVATDDPPSALSDGRWGLVTNDAARLASDADRRSRAALLDAGIDVVRLFSPEHGITTSGADGAAMADATDDHTGLPVVSLYGERMRPPADRVSNLDGVCFDVPDVGARFYTYLWTLSHVLEVCAETATPLWVLDRPVPTGGDLAAAEGPILDPETCGSFLGRAAMPIRYGLTMGEFARWLADEWGLDVDLQVVELDGWSREMHWPDTDLPFVPTSPSMPSYESALPYPGTCLFEATNLSVGRGTDRPFRQVGAPWLDAETVVHALDAGDSRTRRDESDTLPGSLPPLPGVEFEAVGFHPGEPSSVDEPCTGVRLRIEDSRAFRPVRTGLSLLTLVRHLHPAEFAWDTYPTAANPSGEGHFERLVGDPDVRTALEGTPAGFLSSLPGRLDVPDWRSMAAQFTLYE
jgi:uncharacterized protein YbbC (DUF1343 family)